jgi:hypothetical protein
MDEEKRRTRILGARPPAQDRLAFMVHHGAHQ